MRQIDIEHTTTVNFSRYTNWNKRTAELDCANVGSISCIGNRHIIDRARESGAALIKGRTYERSLRMGDRLGGHWVQGHVDGVGVVAGLPGTIPGLGTFAQACATLGIPA